MFQSFLRRQESEQRSGSNSQHGGGVCGVGGSEDEHDQQQQNGQQQQQQPLIRRRLLRDDDSNEEGIDFSATDDDYDFDDDSVATSLELLPEHHYVFLLRYVMLAVLVVSAWIASRMMHQALQTSQTVPLQELTRDAASLLQQAWLHSMQQKVRVLETLAKELQAHVDEKRDALLNNGDDDPWPFVTWPQLDTLAKLAVGEDDSRSSSGDLDPILSALSFLPVVHGYQKEKWEQYSVQHADDWLQLEQQQLNQQLQQESDVWISVDRRHSRMALEASATAAAVSIPSHLFNWHDGVISDYTNETLFLPLWQTYPQIQNATFQSVNLDIYSNAASFDVATNLTTNAMLSLLQHQLNEVLRTGRLVLGYPATLATSSSSSTTVIPIPQKESLSPFSTLMYPVMSTTTTARKNKKRTLQQQNDEKETVAAIFAANFDWMTPFQQVLPPSTSVTVVVNVNRVLSSSSASSPSLLSSATTQFHDDGIYKGNSGVNKNDKTTFSFLILGPTVSWLGSGDLHNHDVDGSASSLAVAAAINKQEQIVSLFVPNIVSNETGANITTIMEITLHVFPTRTMLEHYWTNRPLRDTLIVLALFFVSSLVFCSYDKFVERRQQLIMDQAVQSTAIVSSLFPETVRDRLFQGGRRGSQSESARGGDDASLTIEDNHSFVGAVPTQQQVAVASGVSSSQGHLNGHASFTNASSTTGHNSMRDFGSSTNNSVSFLMQSHQPAKLRLKSFLTHDQIQRGSFVGNNRPNNDNSGNSGNGQNGNGTNNNDKNNNNNNNIVPFSNLSGLGGFASKPIADLFPRCTVLFADISGFTAWSSLRDPEQVFILLESVYQAFDRIARRRGVFKVETIGDSYVAVTGLPEPQDDPNHAVIMALFARDCRRRMGEVTRKLELTLGPDTPDLRMRFGLHSGPVTAGVLRGEKSRFQLFGDTVNTAARMESTGERDRIQVSQATADLIKEGGKGHWLVKRDKPVIAKGKGELTTYWVEIRSRRDSTGENSHCSISSVDSGNTMRSNGQQQGDSGPCAMWGDSEDVPEVHSQKSRHHRLIDYNVDLLAQRLKQVMARRRVLAMRGRRCSQGGLPPDWDLHCDLNTEQTPPIEEVCEIIRLPSFNPKEFKDYIDPDSIELDPVVISQLKRFVTVIAAMYRNNPFHNFEHASHVTMSVNKLLQRVVTPDITFRRGSMAKSSSTLQKQIASDLHNYTYGITSDPLTQFSIVFAALIHDVDHWGVSNMQLVKEEVPLADKYNNKSVAEQNSIDLAWDLLMDRDEYGALHQCIFPTDAEFKRFRQVVVNVVMATDIFDKELSTLRKNRWDKAFSEEKREEPALDAEGRKATIVIEHIMQASDVAHTMQHWHVYQKWNRRLFDELYTAWRAGRMERDPSTFWYESELKFFDGYIIPLAKKLHDCGVFGVSSDECLNYAIDNRREWEAKGKAIVEELVENYLQRENEEQASKGSNTAVKRKSNVSRRRSLMTTGG